MSDKRIMSHYGHAIWYGDGVFMVAKGDGTDKYFSTLEDAMRYCEERPRGKKKVKA